MKKVLKFEADWCQPCKMLTKMLENIKTDIPIEIIDIDDQHEECAKYNIRGVPTMIMLDSSNSEIQRLVGLPSKQKLESWFNS